MEKKFKSPDELRNKHQFNKDTGEHRWHYFAGDVEIDSNNINDLKDYLNAINARKIRHKDILNYKSVNIIGVGADFKTSVNRLEEYKKEIIEFLKDSSSELPNKIRDAFFEMETDYQAYHNLDQDNWDVVHKNYFEIVHTGYQQPRNGEEIQIHAGQHGNIFIYQDNDKLGFIVDVYGENDHVDSMTIWEDDMIGEHEKGIDVEIDDVDEAEVNEQEFDRKSDLINKAIVQIEKDLNGNTDPLHALLRTVPTALLERYLAEE